MCTADDRLKWWLLEKCFDAPERFLEAAELRNEVIKKLAEKCDGNKKYTNLLSRWIYKLMRYQTSLDQYINQLHQNLEIHDPGRRNFEGLRPRPRLEDYNLDYTYILQYLHSHDKNKNF